MNEIQLTKRIPICDSLLKRNENDPFLKRIITGDEKWVVYDNFVQKRLWSKRDEPAQSTANADIHQKKVMLSVCYDFKGIVYFELLPRNQTINSNVFYRGVVTGGVAGGNHRGPLTQGPPNFSPGPRKVKLRHCRTGNS